MRFIAFPSNLVERELMPVIKRLAMIVTGTDRVTEQDDGYRWMLGSANDWWADYDPATNEVTLEFRYSSARQEEMETLRKAVIFVLGVERLNPKTE